MGKLGKLGKLGKPGPLGGRVRRSASFRCSPTTPMNGGVCEARQDRENDMHTLFVVAIVAVIYEGLVDMGRREERDKNGW